MTSQSNKAALGVAVAHPGALARAASTPIPLVARNFAAGEIDRKTLDRMWLVFSTYYTDISRAKFEEDLSHKHRVIVLFDTEQNLVRGFSTIQTYEVTVQGRRVVVIYSGDTIVERDFWGQNALQAAFSRYITSVKLRNPFTPVYWFLISKGYKTYLLLTRNFPEHWPRHDRPIPAWQQALLDLVATDKFGSSYKPEQGILQFDSPMGRLRETVAPVDPALLTAPDIRFFSTKNPGHAQGEELCCLGRVNLDLLWFRAVKRVRRALGDKRSILAGE